MTRGELRRCLHVGAPSVRAWGRAGEGVLHASCNRRDTERRTLAVRARVVRIDAAGSGLSCRLQASRRGLVCAPIRVRLLRDAFYGTAPDPLPPARRAAIALEPSGSRRGLHLAINDTNVEVFEYDRSALQVHACAGGSDSPARSGRSSVTRRGCRASRILHLKFSGATPPRSHRFVGRPSGPNRAQR